MGIVPPIGVAALLAVVLGIALREYWRERELRQRLKQARPIRWHARRVVEPPAQSPELTTQAPLAPPGALAPASSPISEAEIGNFQHNWMDDGWCQLCGISKEAYAAHAWPCNAKPAPGLTPKTSSGFPRTWSGSHPTKAKRPESAVPPGRATSRPDADSGAFRYRSSDRPFRPSEEGDTWDDDGPIDRGIRSYYDRDQSPE